MREEIQSKAAGSGANVATNAKVCTDNDDSGELTLHHGAKFGLWQSTRWIFQLLLMQDDLV